MAGESPYRVFRPAWFHDGLRPAEAMMLAGQSSAPRAMSVREQWLRREFARRSEPELIYQPIGPDAG